MANYSVPHPYNGLYRALVIDDKDPLLKMRVKVRIPDLMVAEEKFVGKWDTNGIWAFPGNNYLGGRNNPDMMGQRMTAEEGYYQGSCLIPPKGSHVWILFEKHDPSHPHYIAAAEYGDTQALPENQLGKEYQKKWTLIKTNQGRCLIASDDDSDARWEITGKKRKITNPPFGDTDSVYEIDDNQTVFLIDERPDHEKVLLKDYRGNFFKLIQNENGINDQFHGYIQDDVHLEVDQDFYLTVHGNFHLKVDKNIYIQSFQNIYVKATKQLKENAKSFDRYSQTYDNTFSGLVNIKSDSNINMNASMDIFQDSIRNIRNSMVTSDVSTGKTTIKAGDAIGIKAGGAVSIYGDGGTAIQSTPVENPLSGNTDKAKTSLQATKAKPDPERYQEQEFAGKSPILKLPTYKDSVVALPFEHSLKPKVQCNNAQVKGAGSSASGSDAPSLTNKSSNNSNKGSNCCGGGKTLAEITSNPEETLTDMAAEKGADTLGVDKETAKAAIAGAKIYTGTASPNDYATVGKYAANTASSALSGVSSCGGTKFSATKIMFKSSAVNNSSDTVLPSEILFNSLNEVCQIMSDEVSSSIIGIGDTTNQDRLDYVINDLVKNTAEKSSYEFNKDFMKSVSDSSVNASLAIAEGTNIAKVNTFDVALDVYNGFRDDRRYLLNEFIDETKTELTDNLSGTYDSQIMDKDTFVSNALDGILTSSMSGNTDKCLDSAIDTLSDDFSDKVISGSLDQSKQSFDSTVSKLTNISNSEVGNLTENQIRDISNNIKTNISEANTNMKQSISNSMSFVG